MNSLSISTLLCHKDMGSALICLGSLKQFCVDPVRLFIHDDGSLTDEDVATLHEKLQPERLIRRLEANERMEAELVKYPVSAAYRRRCVMGLKLLDSLSYNTADTYIYCDSDILFLRRFAGLFELPAAPVNAVFMTDLHSNYSCRSWSYLTSSLRLPYRFNAGLGCVRRSSYDRDFIEWFLSNPRHVGKPHLVFHEQTAWAALAARCGCMTWSDRQIAMATPSLRLSEEMIALHVVGMVRAKLLPQYLEQRGKLPVDAPVARAELRVMGTCHWHQLFLGECARVMDRLMARFK